MEEIQQTNSVSNEPEKVSENLNETTQTSPEVSKATSGQSVSDPNLILGKFKTQDDLINAYKELEKLQGSQSAELGNLRQNSLMLRNIQEVWQREAELKDCAQELQEAANKYNTPEYFQDPSFKEIYKEAYLALGKNLDTDRFVNLIEGYVSSRLMKYEQQQAAKSETAKAIGGMKFDKNKNTSLKTSTGKRIDQMTTEEINAILDKFI